ncbi:MAG: head-tail connector protein [Alteromonas macleodii]
MQNYNVTVLTAPTVEPIDLEAAKYQLRVQHGKEDDYIRGLIKASRAYVENFCNRYFSTQQIALSVSETLPDKFLKLPFPDLVSIDSFYYYDDSGDEVLIPATDYSFDSQRQIVTAVTAFPVATNGYKLNLTTGAPVEFEGAKIALKMYLADLYNNRVSQVNMQIHENPAANAHLFPYRVNMGV